MAAVVSLELARKHLRLDVTDEDVLVDVYLAAAEQSVTDFLGRQVYPDALSLAAAVLAGDAGDSPIVINPAITAAVLLILGHLYAQREDTVVGVSVVELPRGARSLLWPHRTGLGV